MARAAPSQHPPPLTSRHGIRDTRIRHDRATENERHRGYLCGRSIYVRFLVAHNVKGFFDSRKSWAGKPLVDPPGPGSSWSHVCSGRCRLLITRLFA